MFFRFLHAMMIVKNIQLDVTNDTDNEPIKEADLDGHLDNGVPENNIEKKGEKSSSLIETDYQLYEALNVLKGLSIHLKKDW